MAKNIERACLISYIDCADDLVRKVIDENLSNGASLLKDEEFEGLHDSLRLFVSIIERLQREMSEEDPNRIIIPNGGDF